MWIDCWRHLLNAQIVCVKGRVYFVRCVGISHILCAHRLFENVSAAYKQCFVHRFALSLWTVLPHVVNNFYAYKRSLISVTAALITAS